MPSARSEPRSLAVPERGDLSRLFKTVGALFVPFSPHIVAHALNPLNWQKPEPTRYDHYFFQDWIYTQMGYTLDGYTAKLPPKPNPFQYGKPPWAK